MPRVFLSHEWGKHAFAVEAARQLRARNIGVWIDEDCMKGDVVYSMCEGIDEADVVLVLLTKRYVEKVASGYDLDNCLCEFMYATQRSHAIMPVLCEDMPGKWSGPVGMFLKRKLYVDLRGGTDAQFDRLAQKIAERAADASRTKHAGLVVSPSTCKAAGGAAAGGAEAAAGGAEAAAGGAEAAAVMTIAERVARAKERMGGRHASGRVQPTGEAVDELFASLAGAPVEKKPIHQKLSIIEMHLGIAD